MPMQANDIERLIKARIPDAEVTIRDLPRQISRAAAPARL
jgi:hypothetical protein